MVTGIAALLTIHIAVVAETVRIMLNVALKGKGRYSSSWEPHLRATGRHLLYGIIQCYLPAEPTQVNTPRLTPAI